MNAICWVVASMLVAGCGGVDGVSVEAQAAPTPTASATECDMNAVWSALISTGSPGAATPEAALTQFLETAADQPLAPPDTTPVLVGETETTATYAWRDEDGRTVATLGLFNEGSGWHATSGSNCY